MNILTQFQSFQNETSHINNITSLYDKIAHPLFTNRSASNYAEMIEHIGLHVFQLARDQIKFMIESIDRAFRDSTVRKERYYVKNTRTRTIVTPYGEITYTRTLYSFKDKSKGIYTHIDELFNIPKYDRYDPCVKAQMVSLYANHNSMIKVGKILGEQIFAPFSLDKKRFLYAIPRQTIQTAIKNASKVIFPLDKKESTPETIYIMADEKMVPLQSHNTEGKAEKQMVKAAVVFEDIQQVPTKTISKKPRHALVNKYVHLCTEPMFWENVYEKVNEMYDLEKVKNIYILGDGATWIKAGVGILQTQNTKVEFILDKFHFQQSLTRIEKEKEIRKQMNEYILHDKDKKLFRQMVESLIEESPTRKESILKEEKYILNHWNSIQKAYHEVTMGCSMESAISHYLASSFTSVPKGYERNNLSTYVKHRQHRINKVDLAKLYIQSLDYKTENGVINIKDKLDFSFFEKNSQGNDKSTKSNWTKGFIARH